MALIRADVGGDPAQQQEGIGSTVLPPVLARADAARLPDYLETLTMRSVLFYAHHGFVDVFDASVAPDGPHFWTMIRNPTVECERLRRAVNADADKSTSRRQVPCLFVDRLRRVPVAVVRTRARCSALAA